MLNSEEAREEAVTNLFKSLKPKFSNLESVYLDKVINLITIVANFGEHKVKLGFTEEQLLAAKNIVDFISEKIEQTLSIKEMTEEDYERIDKFVEDLSQKYPIASQKFGTDGETFFFRFNPNDQPEHGYGVYFWKISFAGKTIEEFIEDFVKKNIKE